MQRITLHGADNVACNNSGCNLTDAAQHTALRRQAHGSAANDLPGRQANASEAHGLKPVHRNDGATVYASRRRLAIRERGGATAYEVMRAGCGRLWEVEMKRLILVNLPSAQRQ